ncbi:uncharacterized protein LOC104455534 [Eucalyptus grandis]|uniref:uncharacterized protein LOC104455534 n=1 Tax=Eucalyptus grandis TaxID=71139 RepID=UPI00192EEE3A|nr:uncharacterized protein LOC104455534 [Eucalyptus grandis]
MPTVEVSEKYRPLFEAVVKGDREAVEKILNEDHEAKTAKVMTMGKTSATLLDVAVMVGQDQLVENLVKRFPSEYYVVILISALNHAVRRGRIRMVKALVDRVDAKSESVPHALSMATSYAPMQKEVIWYLARHTTSAPDHGTMSCLIMAGHLDIGLYFARQYPGLATSEDTENNSLLGDLVKMKSYFRSGARLNFWEKSIYKCIPLCLVDTSFDNSIDPKMGRALKWFKTSLWNLTTKSAPFIKRIGELKLRHQCSLEFANLALTEKKTRMQTPEMLEFLLASGIVLDAASHGIFEIVSLCLKHFPELMWDENFTKELMKQVVSGRHVELFRLVNAHYIPYLTNDAWEKHGLMKATTEWSPRCATPDVSGAVFLIQRELQWYKVLEDRSDPSSNSLVLLEGPLTKKTGRKTYWEVFVEQRQDLFKEAGQWMKNTSSTCSIVATIIITVSFSAALKVPGGNNGSTGIPIFLKKGSFTVFAIADALALFSSVPAALMFLAILTSHYTIEDFLHSLPRKLIMGLTFLFLSLAFILVAFSSILTIVLSERLKWIYIPITLLAAFPIVLFAILHLPLWVEMVESTYWPRLYRRMKKIWK